VERGLGPVLEHGHHVAAERSDLLVGLAQLGEVLAAGRSAKMAHKRHDERTISPPIAQLDRPIGVKKREIGKFRPDR
jgi:hypothetical protein